MRIAKCRIPTVVGMLVLSMLLLGGCGETSLASSVVFPTTTSVPPNTITITQGEQFSPFILEVSPGTAVTWYNNDVIAHTLQNTPLQSTFLNPAPLNLHVAPGSTTTFSFTAPGIYDYFDNHIATWNKKDQRVQADPQYPNYPEAMEGVVWVTGPIVGMPKQAENAIPSGHDDFVTDFLAIQAGGTVTWHNHDTAKHYLSWVTGWQGDINPATTLQLVSISGTTDQPPNGGSATQTFTKPGLYYYFCTAHAEEDTTWHRVMAHPDSSESPIPMEGFVLVLANG